MFTFVISILYTQDTYYIINSLRYTAWLPNKLEKFTFRMKRGGNNGDSYPDNSITHSNRTIFIPTEREFKRPAKRAELETFCWHFVGKQTTVATGLSSTMGRRVSFPPKYADAN